MLLVTTRMTWNIFTRHTVHFSSWVSGWFNEPPFKNLGDLLPSTDLSWLMVFHKVVGSKRVGFLKFGQTWKTRGFHFRWGWLGVFGEWDNKWVVIGDLDSNELTIWWTQIAVAKWSLSYWNCGYSISMLVYQRLNLWSNNLEILDSRLKISIKIQCVLTDEHPEVYISILYFWSVVLAGDVMNTLLWYSSTAGWSFCSECCIDI